MSEAAPSVDDLVGDPKLDWHEGGGIVSDVVDTADAYTRPHTTSEDSYQATAAALGLGLSGLGAVTDPVGTLLGAGFGWLIEHLEFLREPLDKLAGNPRDIKAHAQTWHNVGRELTVIADKHATSLTQLGGWTGAAADAYRTAAAREGEALREGAASAEELSALVMKNGATVGTVRSLIRDLIVELLVKLVEWLAPVVAAAFATAGATLVPYIAAAVAKALELAAQIAEVISKLLRHLDEVGLVLGRLAGRVDEVAAGLASGANGVRAAGDAVSDAAARAAKELGKREIQPLREVAKEFVEDQAEPETVAARNLEPHKQNGTAIRDRDAWAEEDAKWVPLTPGTRPVG